MRWRNFRFSKFVTINQDIFSYHLPYVSLFGTFVIADSNYKRVLRLRH